MCLSTMGFHLRNDDPFGVDDQRKIGREKLLYPSKIVETHMLDIDLILAILTKLFIYSFFILPVQKRHVHPSLLFP